MLRAVSSKRAVSCAPLPKVFTSSAPETDSVSCMWELSVASCSDDWVSSARWALPTLRAGITNSGRKAIDHSASRASKLSITTSVLPTMITFSTTEPKVSETADCTPETSLDTRDSVSPVRLAVNQRSDMADKCRYSRTRRSSTTAWPAQLDRKERSTPTSAPAATTATISSDSRLIRPRSPAGMA